nr:RNA-dependent RNA polymerase 6 [Tanacetum cinerariifolium]
MRALYSSHIACFQLGSRKAWKGDLGIGEEVVTCKLYLWLAFIILTLERVTIGCCEVAGGGGGVVGGVSVVCGDGVDSGVGGVNCGFVFGLFMVVFIEENWSHRAKGKDSFVKCEMTRNDFIGVQAKASISTMIPGFLYRQIITLLSALGVEDDIFWDMQMKNVMNLNQMLIDNDVAYDEITTLCTESENTSSIMLGAGFNPQIDSHLQGMLISIRVAQLKGLREKSRIFLQDERWLMCCLNELDVIQVLKVVNVPGIEHLVDRLIFPRKGERPHTDEASGSDLDGNLYFVTWDDHLILPSKQSWLPMEYTTAEAKELSRETLRSPHSDNDLKHNGRTTFIEKAQWLLWTKASMHMSFDTKRLRQNNGNNKRGKIMEKHVTTVEEIKCPSGGVVSVSKIFVILKLWNGSRRCQVVARRVIGCKEVDRCGAFGYKYVTRCGGALGMKNAQASRGVGKREAIKNLSPLGL